MVELADRSELIAVGDGMGSTTTTGGGGGGGGTKPWARAEVEASATNNTKATAAAATNRRPIPRPAIPRLAILTLAVRESLDEARIKSIPENKRRSAKKSRPDGIDLPSVHPERQSATAAGSRRLPDIVVLLPQRCAVGT
jgi:hypothetical protein